VEQLGLPEGGPMLAFEQASPDAAIGQAWKQTVLSDDGGRLFTRFFRGGSWERTWSTVPVASIGIGAFPEVFVPGLTAIRSFSQGVNPAGQPKQEFLSPDGTQLHTRVFTNGAWGTWQTPLRVPDLGLPLLPPSSG
jgi:hypothetical protein